jgi:hypothetical protein
VRRSTEREDILVREVGKTERKSREREAEACNYGFSGGGPRRASASKRRRKKKESIADLLSGSFGGEDRMVGK